MRLRVLARRGFETRAYRRQPKSAVPECAAHPAADGARTPFATVSRWVAKHTVDVSPGTQLAGLQATLDELMSTHNYLYAVRLEGRFRSITVRSVRPQQPGTRLIDATRTQTERTFDDCEGTVVGFYTPEFLPTSGCPASTSTSSRVTEPPAATCSRSRPTGGRHDRRNAAAEPRPDRHGGVPARGARGRSG